MVLVPEQYRRTCRDGVAYTSVSCTGNTAFLKLGTHVTILYIFHIFVCITYDKYSIILRNWWNQPVGFGRNKLAVHQTIYIVLLSTQLASIF